MAFNVPQPTVDIVRAEITPQSASTTPVTIVPVIQSPIVQNAPIYFGSTAPVNNTTTTQTPVIQSAPMDKSDIVIVEARQRPADAQANQPFGSVTFFIHILDSEGNYTPTYKTPLADTFTMKAPDNIYGETMTVPQPDNGMFYVPTTGGTKTVTFTYGALTKSYPVTF